MIQNLLRFWTNLFVVQFYRVRKAFRASRTRLAEQMRNERSKYSRRSLQSGVIITMEDGRHMVRQLDDDGGEIAEEAGRKGLKNA